MKVIQFLVDFVAGNLEKVQNMKENWILDSVRIWVSIGHTSTSVGWKGVRWKHLGWRSNAKCFIPPKAKDDKILVSW